MSYPILYSATETNFDHNGIGILSACVSCEVTEEANGIFELAMTYPMDGVHYSQISDRCLIKAKPNNEAEPQLFRVYSIKKTMSGVAIVYAKHISYDLSGIPVSVFTADNAPSAMMGLAQNAVVDCPFVFMTDKTTVANFSVRYPGSIRSKLGGSSGSILDVYGGEYEFDNYNVILHHQRGRNRGVSIRYGKNLTDIQQDRNCGSVATGVYPYWFDSESEKVIELPEKIVNVDGTYDFSKIKMLALSDDFTSKPTEDEIRSRTESYIKNNNVGVPDVSLSVSFSQLEQSEEYKGLALLEKVSLFDTVSVEFPALGVSATAKAVKIIYNVIMDRVESVTLGSVKSNIADTLANQQQQIEQAPSKNYVQSVANAASAVSTAWLTNGEGYKVERRDANGNTVDTLYMDTPDINTAVNVLRIGQSGIGFSNNGVNGPYYSAWTLDGRFNADFIQAGSIKSNDGKSVVIDLDKGTADIVGSVTTRTIDDGAGGVYVSSLSPNGLSIGTDDAPINTHIFRDRLQFVGKYGDVLIQNALSYFNGSRISLADRSLHSRVIISASPEGSTDPGGQITLSAEDTYNSNGLTIKCGPSQSYISGLTAPTYPSSAVNKEYVDGEISALAPNGIIPVANGGTGGTTIAEAQSALHVTQDYLFSQLDSAGNKSLNGIDAYPTSPGVFRVTTNSAAVGVPGNYGCLVIFNGGSYYMHLYVNADGFWTARTTSMAVPTAWNKAATTADLAQAGQQVPLFANSIEECTDTSKLYVLPDGYIYAWMYKEVEVGGYTNLVGTSKTGFQTGYRMKAISAEPATTSEANSFVSNAFPCKQGDILRIRGVGISSKNSATAQQFMVVPVDSSGAVVKNHGFALGEPLYNSTQQMFTTWKRAWNAIETADDGTITWTYAINNAGEQKANMNLSEATTAVRLSGIAINGYDNVIVTVNEEIIEHTVAKEYTWVNTGHAFVPADYEGRIVTLEEDVTTAQQDISEHESRIDTIEDDVSAIKQAISYDGLLNYDIFDYAYIKSGELVANKLNITGNQNGHYTGVKMDGNVKRIMCKAKFSANSSVVLITTKLGSSVIANITRGSIHLIFSMSGCAVGIYDDGTGSLRNVKQYSCSTKEGVEVSFGYAVDETTNTLTVYLPNGTTETVTDSALSVVNGQYAIWEHFCGSVTNGFKCCRITKLWCEDVGGNILDDDLKRLDGAIGVAPTGQTYRQFRTGHQTNRNFA